MLIPKNTSVLIHQVPGRPRVRLITAQEPRIENKVEHVQAETSNSHVALPPAAKYVHSIIIHVMFLHQQKRKYMKKANFRPRLTPQHLTGRGHCIHHFSTNGDSNYNVKRVKPPTGIPKYMLVALIHCQVVQLQLLNQKRNLDAFDKEIEGLPSTTRSVGEFTSRCCFQSFCVTSFRSLNRCPGVRHSTFESLRLGRSSHSIAFGFLRLWDSLNFKKDMKFVGITVLFLNEKVNSVIHKFTPVGRANHYMPSLKAGFIVKVDRFEVARCSSMYKITDHPFFIGFIPLTIIDEVIMGAPEINLQSKLDCLKSPNVVGQIRSVQVSRSYQRNNSSRYPSPH
ncbi:hypothetical protein F2Q70_00009247 [Brassica cretica]|uniref:DWNN domain-containing protein n=1 Tax=Brassica cretica TaxID=69181 RepID=A0A8S9LXC1_BRACR|nr:hypothetical protein F2Q70_00009247 [Brassica cretica]